MPLICYIDKDFRGSSVDLIEKANEILEEYAQQGFDLTLRQLYYQFVSRDLIANTQKEYKRLGSVINDARLAGLIDWNSIVDRTRNLEALAKWDDPSHIIDACASQFRYDKWAVQEHRPEVWIEKDALGGVIEKVCKDLQVSYFSCRGYTSQSEMWSAAQRLVEYFESGQKPFVIHLGDHDPSGIDMSRDIQDRLNLFMDHHGAPALNFTRIALNMNQVKKYNPPPNPAKITDSRAAGYISKHGNESWELDALEPRVMASLIRSTVETVRDQDKWDEEVEREKRAKKALRFAANNWKRIEFISCDGDWSEEDFDLDDGRYDDCDD
jgi:hypothetical protein